MRKLASIQKIKNLEFIPEADLIEKATILGWQLLVKKNEFKIGDLCVYCEIDSLFPEKEEFDFLKSKGMRIRTIRLRGQISQGICFPLSILPETIIPEEDLDVTEVMGITKYEPPIPASLAGKVKGLFPAFIPKTDETRVQVLQEVLDIFKNETCYVTEKLDGSSVTYFLKDNVFGVCSRNLELTETEENSFWKVARQLNIEEKLRRLNRNLALQGELIGEGIQSNRYDLKGQKVYFFNVFDIDTYTFLSFEEFENIMENMELNTVPVLEKDFKPGNDINILVEKSMAKSVLNPLIWREGIVIRPLKEKRTIKYGRTSFKAINTEFLLKYE